MLTQCTARARPSLYHRVRSTCWRLFSVLYSIDSRCLFILYFSSYSHSVSSGDFVAHDLPDEDTVLRAHEETVNSLRASFPYIPVVACIGNNDLPRDYEFDTASSSSSFLEKLSKAWDPILRGTNVALFSVTCGSPHLCPAHTIALDPNAW